MSQAISQSIAGISTDQNMVSIIIPCLNEDRFIEGVIKCILDQDYDQDELEVLFIDGGSTDGTREIILEYTRTYPNICLIDNPDKFVPQAMNKGIALAQGQFIIRLDAHAEYPPNYVSRLIYWLKKLNAENVGGIWKITPRNSGLKAISIAGVLAHPLGVGNAAYRLGAARPIEVDTVPFGCYPKSVFEKYGNYDIRLRRNQDIELNKRIRRNGGSIVLVPEISCTYFARDTYADLCKNNYENGKWVVLASKLMKNLSSLSFRHFVPLLFCTYLICFLVFGLIGIYLQANIFLLLLSIPMVIYLISILTASVQITLKQSNPGLFVYLVVGFILLHTSYGAGSLVGISRPA